VKNGKVEKLRSINISVWQVMDEWWSEEEGRQRRRGWGYVQNALEDGKIIE